MTDLIIIGDEAWLPEEWQAEQLRREQARARRREYESSPERRAERARYWREWRKIRGEKYRQYQREYKKLHRVLSQTDEALRSKIDYHQGFVDRYTAELRARRREAA